MQGAPEVTVHLTEGQLLEGGELQPCRRSKKVAGQRANRPHEARHVRPHRAGPERDGQSRGVFAEGDAKIRVE